MRSSDVVVVGGGVIGCAIAYYSAKRGLRVTLVDQPKRGRATSASAGGLWPVGESMGLGCGVIFSRAQAAVGTLPGAVSHPGQLPTCFFDFAIRSNAMFPALSEELRAGSGIDIEWERTTLLFIMYDEGDLAFARSLRELCPGGRDLMGWLTPEELAEAEPAVTREARGALVFHGDDQVNPYRLADAFRSAARKLGASVLSHTEVTGVRVQSGRVTAAELTSGLLPCDLVVNAAGAWAPQIGRMVGSEIPVRPVRGQILGTESLPKLLSACISTNDCYLMQKGHGEVIIGSTTEEVGFEVGVTPSAMKSLSAGGIRAVPSLEHVRVKRAWSGLRPGTPDELPILGPIEGVEGYLNACGHFRTGILNAPLTGLLIAELACGERPSFPIEPFLLRRFVAERDGPPTVTKRNGPTSLFRETRR
jgi:hydrogen cyanide synthase HcnC